MENKNIIIEYALLNDTWQIAALEEECFSMPWSVKALQESMSKDYSLFLKAVADGRIIGYVGLYHSFGEADITNIAVSEKYRSKGVGTKLLEQLILECKLRQIKSITLEVRKSNINAIKLYEKTGFVQLGERRNFYEKPVENAVIMKINLN